MGFRSPRHIAGMRDLGSATAGRRVAGSVLLGVLALLLAPTAARAVVVINEIHYHPPSPGGKTLEFIELLNDSGEAVGIGGWSFSRGVDYRFPSDAIIPAGELVVVARDRAELIREFGIAGARVFGNYDGVLDNGGDEVVLVDAQNAHVDAVSFDDRVPWPTAADGDGGSLQRICATGPSWTFRNWGASAAAGPTPLAVNVGSGCPLPEFQPPPVVFTEINYHPANDTDAFDEFVEIHNRTDTDIDVSGWRFIGVTFEFPPKTTLGAGEFLAVCRNAAHVRSLYSIETAVGDFVGRLSNGGESLLLLDAEGRLVDFVRYGDSGDWPVSVDAGGPTLEKMDPSAPSDDPGSWSESHLQPQGFTTLTATGPLTRLLTQRFLLGVNGAGEYIVDNVSLERVDELGVNLIPDGGFEEGVGSWLVRGNASRSTVENGIGVGGSAGLRLVGEESCSGDCGGCSSSQSVALSIRGLENDVDYRLSVDYRFVSGSPKFYCRLLRGFGVCLGEILATPGQENSNSTEVLPPFISHRGRFPLEPTSEDRTQVTAKVRSPSGRDIEAVELTWFLGEESGTVAMLDDGESGDHDAGDGVFGVRMPGFEHDSPVVYHITARTTDGRVGATPRVSDVGNLLREDLWGFYVNDDQPDSPISTYHIVFRQANADRPDQINNVLNCQMLEACDFIFGGEVYPDVGLRFRGNTACVLKKRNLKLKFNRGRWFRGLRKMNLQGIWTDKSLVREHVAWRFITDLGVPSCETEYIRVHLNGQYHGLFLYLEHPDEQFLERNGLSDDDCLYKARQPTGAGGTPVGVSNQSSSAAFAAFWERETCKTEDFTELADFVGAMHSDAAGAGPSAEFHLQRTFPRWQIGYQVAQIALNNIDSFAKNHFLLFDRSEDRWGMVCWDMDLVFGKNFDGRLNRPNPPRVGTINDCMLSPGDDLNPWFTTTVRGNTRLHYFIDFLFNADRGFFRRAYVIRLWDILHEKYNNDAYDPFLDDLEALLVVEQEEDFARWGRSPVTCLADCGNCARGIDMQSNLDEVKEQIRRHRGFLISYLTRFHAEFLDHDKMKITELMFNPVGVREDLEFIELLNTSDRAVDLSGWALTEGVGFVFPPATRVMPNGIVIVAKSRETFLARNPGLPGDVLVLGDYDGSLNNDGDTVRLVDAGEGFPATIDFVRYSDGGEWPDIREGHSIEVAVPVDANTDNDNPDNWRMSALQLGTPGRIEGLSVVTFLRGDTNADGRVNISDPVATLDFLFTGGQAPRCLDAADVDDNGSVMLSDAVIVLDFLFRSGLRPQEPFPEPGVDPTPDELFCK